MWRRRNPDSFLVGVAVATTTMEINVEASEKTRTRAQCDPAIPLIDIHPRDSIPLTETPEHPC